MVVPRVLPLLMISWGLAAQTVAQTAAQPAPVRLTLQDAIATSLKNNLQVQLAREARTITQSGVLNAEGAFDWNLGGTFSWSKADSSSYRQFYPGAPLTRTETSNWNRNLTASLNKPFDWGGTFQMNYNPVYNMTSGSVSSPTADTTFSTPAPYSGTVSATYTQSLLKGFGREDTGSALLVAKLGARSADYTFLATIIGLVATTESAYWDVVYGQRNLEAKRQSLELAQKQLNENRIRVEVGTMAPLDVINAEAAVAQAEQNIIAAEAQLVVAQETFIRTVYPNTERPVKVETTDAPTLSHIMLKQAEAEKMALERRVELKSARLDLESRSIQLKAAENRIKPQLDAFLSYAGTSDNHRAIGPVNGDLLATRDPGYTVGVNFSYPLLNKAARGNEVAARANRRSSELSLRDQELSVLLDVRTATVNLEAAEKGVKAAEKTRYFTEKDLEAERKKFENGMSTNFLVLSKLTTLDGAKSAEVQAQITYAKAVTALEKAVGNLLEARNLKME